jgi:acyl phosphate:glycerol-3-phosphate acyltransferase
VEEQMININNIIAYVISYLLGSIPSGVLLAKLFKVSDLRKHGSGNIGATNALRVGGKKLGILTLLADSAKGMVSVLVGQTLFCASPYVCAILCILGHMFPVWLKFKGGKGVATSLGVLLILNWQLSVIAMSVWLFVFIVTRYVSLASIISFLSMPLLVLIFNFSSAMLYTAIIIAILVVIKHHENIVRLVKKQEKKF